MPNKRKSQGIAIKGHWKEEEDDHQERRTGSSERRDITQKKDGIGRKRMDRKIQQMIFFFVESSQTSKVGNTLKIFQEVCDTICIPLASDKTALPTTLLTFLGIEFDKQNLIMRLPNEKLVKLSQKDTLDSSKITLKDMQSLLELLNFACKVVAPGRTFCRRLINSAMGVRKSYYKIRADKSRFRSLVRLFKTIPWCYCNNRQCMGFKQKIGVVHG
ncbi:unnamed protein product [Mytilus edulis]|uniref:Uncharacterized protein n=1 Tax=Mytilus edulis TaxID=6550 RepID=A0A8S3UMV3_MYTED|nr:unnamed protein product [Mytilus edulis]